jgi:prevent-host-death family protein
MERLGIRDLRNQTAAAVRRAGAGERLVITVDGRPVAQLGPLDPGGGAATLEDLAARGLVVLPRRGDRPLPDVQVDLWAGTRIDRAAAELRGDLGRRGRGT